MSFNATASAAKGRRPRAAIHPSDICGALGTGLGALGPCLLEDAMKDGSYAVANLS